MRGGSGYVYVRGGGSSDMFSSSSLGARMLVMRPPPVVVSLMMAAAVVLVASNLWGRSPLAFLSVRISPMDAVGSLAVHLAHPDPHH